MINKCLKSLKSILENMMNNIDRQQDCLRYNLNKKFKLYIIGKDICMMYKNFLIKNSVVDKF